MGLQLVVHAVVHANSDQILAGAEDGGPAARVLGLSLARHAPNPGSSHNFPASGAPVRHLGFPRTGLLGSVTSRGLRDVFAHVLKSSSEERDIARPILGHFKCPQMSLKCP